MAKQEKDKQQDQVEKSVDPAPLNAEADAPFSEQQAVEKQAAVHEAASNVPQPALQPGKQLAPSKNMVEELHALVAKAEQAGERALASELKGVLVKLGNLLMHVQHVEEKAAAHVKPIYAKILAFFKK